MQPTAEHFHFYHFDQGSYMKKVILINIIRWQLKISLPNQIPLHTVFNETLQNGNIHDGLVPTNFGWLPQGYLTSNCDHKGNACFPFFGSWRKRWKREGVLINTRNLWQAAIHPRCLLTFSDEGTTEEREEGVPFLCAKGKPSCSLLRRLEEEEALRLTLTDQDQKYNALMTGNVGVNSN